MSALPTFKEPDVISATADEAMEVLRCPSAWDADHHDLMWWTARIDDAGFFDRLDTFAKAELLHALAKDNSHWTADMRKRLEAVIEQEIAT
ncbi:hypothetical protein [Bordetella genomosp. 9]|uniref:Uncharacterized protein n=1 Tax=Bordetella genomosp. 9 TaxID=1416803 RepID=A0A1W6YYV2_9BORD|nr:hypothetical protein [Bordetella genomosp. 9]ARP86270.1 hypothetical protein CAL13_08710 [Bordetella genomosp. 9]ARP89792.1 hypothetical protein CAL14_05410 [Bordetella genomosp. 9]